MSAMKMLAMVGLAVAMSGAGSSSQEGWPRDAVPANSAVAVRVVAVADGSGADTFGEKRAEATGAVEPDGVVASATAWFPDPPSEPVCCQGPFLCEVLSGSCPSGSVPVPCPCVPDQHEVVTPASGVG